MDLKNEVMDEEKSFEVIQEGHREGQRVEFATPHMVKRSMGEVSAMFDRNGKGYLDETERALRRMDSTDKGFLGIDKVCLIFESLQTEQERSTQLLDALRIESKKSMNLKKGVIALSFFTVLLALANVATSFAVSKLVKDMQVSNGDLTATGSNQRLATTTKLVVFPMESLDEGRRRRLQTSAGLVCAQMTSNTDGTGATSTTKECSFQGVIQNSVAEDIYEQLETLDKVILSCNFKRSAILGNLNLPVHGPANIRMGETNYTVYPDGSSADEKYQAIQNVQVPPVQADAANGIAAAASYYCDAHYQLGIYCPTDGTTECLVMSAYNPTTAIDLATKLPCPVSPVVCGPTPASTPY